MAGQIRCEQITRRGRPCRNPALPNSNPPRCARHRPKSAAGKAVATQSPLFDPPPEEERKPAAKRKPRQIERKASPASPASQLSLPFAEELSRLESDGLSPNLNREVQEVRVVILRLLGLWDDPAQEISAEEARRLAALIFSGARTVAHLLSRQTKEGSGQEWLAQVLDELGEKYGVNL